MQRRSALALGLSGVVLAVGLAVGVRSLTHQEPEAPPPAPTEPESKLVDQRVTLKNGLDVLTVSGPCEGKAALALRLGFGMDDDPPGRSGLAFVLGEVLSTRVGTDTAPTRAHVGPSATHIALAVDRAALPERLAELAALWSELEVTQEQLDIARRKVQAEQARRAGSDAAATAMAYAAESAHSSRAKGHLGGIPEETQQITPEEVESFWASWGTPRGARVVLAGELDPTAAHAEAAKELGTLAGHEPPDAPEWQVGTVSGNLVMGDAPVALAFAAGAPEAQDPDYPAFLVLATRLATMPAPWELHFEPEQGAQALVLTRAIEPSQTPEVAANALRADVARRVEGPVSPGDVERTLERFDFLVGRSRLDPARCARDVVAFAIAHAHTEAHRREPQALDSAVRKVDDPQLDEARVRFSRKRSVVAAAGGVIR